MNDFFQRNCEQILTQSEKEALKIIVKVSKGSSIFSIILPELVEPLMESISNTTQIELFRNQALIISAKVIVSFFSKWLDSKITLSDKQNKDNKQFSYKRKNSKWKFFNIISNENEEIDINGKNLSERDIANILNEN